MRTTIRWFAVVMAMCVCGCGCSEALTEGEAAGAQVCDVPWGVEFLAMVGGLAIILLILGFLLWFGPFFRDSRGDE